ncbi:hypothetical protein FQN49_005098 [Arthroderma sp. PD_2]|nr:hypothetical protein FQN49_005098 [Arthroderma sp. PD_2]
MTPRDESSQGQEQIPQETWPTLEGIPRFEASTIPCVGCQFFTPSPSTILKVGTDEGEAIMTALGRSIIGPLVPRVDCIVTIPAQNQKLKPRQGIVISRQPGTPLVELWPSLSPPQRKTIKMELCQILVRMRARQFSYYGRPARQPYLLSSEFGTEVYTFCTSRLEWDDSRIQALRASDKDSERLARLEKVQRDTTGVAGWDRPVLTHADLSDRNILIDPHTLKVTGFLDWETANIMPAYFEYVDARLSGGHQPEWRVELLDVLRSVLRNECDAGNANTDEREEAFNKTLAAWDAVVNVERFAQKYDDTCYWTFENGLPASQKTDSAL